MMYRDIDEITDELEGQRSALRAIGDFARSEGWKALQGIAGVNIQALDNIINMGVSGMDDALKIAGHLRAKQTWQLIQTWPAQVQTELKQKIEMLENELELSRNYATARENLEQESVDVNDRFGHG